MSEEEIAIETINIDFGGTPFEMAVKEIGKAAKASDGSYPFAEYNYTIATNSAANRARFKTVQCEKQYVAECRNVSFPSDVK